MFHKAHFLELIIYLSNSIINFFMTLKGKTKHKDKRTKDWEFNGTMFAAKQETQFSIEFSPWVSGEETWVGLLKSNSPCYFRKTSPTVTD